MFSSQISFTTTLIRSSLTDYHTLTVLCKRPRSGVLTHSPSRQRIHLHNRHLPSHLSSERDCPPFHLGYQVHDNVSISTIPLCSTKEDKKGYFILRVSGSTHSNFLDRSLQTPCPSVLTNCTKSPYYLSDPFPQY